MKTKTKKIGILGLWHLGCVYAASLAKLGFDVTGYDSDEKKVDSLKKLKPPIEEPFLTETITDYSGNLHFTKSPQEAISNQDYLFITYDVPVDDQDKVNLAVITKTVDQIKKYLSPDCTVVISSQLPVGTSRKILEVLKKTEPSVNVIYFPENLRLGSAFDSFLKPDRVVVGSDNQEVLKTLEIDLYALNCPFIKIGLESAEMTKHAMNVYLATMISYSSELSDLSESLGANMNEVVLALKTEKRISPQAPISPGLGFAGGTLGRDIQTLRNLSKTVNYQPRLLKAVYEVNQDRLHHLLDRLKMQEKNLKTKKIGILGLTYKPFTNTLRRSMSLELIDLLHQEKVAHLAAYDPTVKEKPKGYSFLKVYDSLPTLLKEADIIILMTQWPEFTSEEIVKNFQGQLVVDTKNFFNKDLITKTGLNYMGMGF